MSVVTQTFCFVWGIPEKHALAASPPTKTMNTSFIASLQLEFQTVQGVGATREDAVQDCLRELSKLITCDVTDTESGFCLPEDVFATMSQTIPEGCVRVCFVACSHSSGHPYDWRHVAVPKGSQVVRPGGNLTSKIEKDTVISFLDCNSDYQYGLPTGSYMWKDDAWVPAREVVYHY